MNKEDSLELAALIDGEAVPIGAVSALRFEYHPNLEPIEVTNVLKPVSLDVSSEELTVSFEVKMSPERVREIFGGFMPEGVSTGLITFHPPALEAIP